MGEPVPIHHLEDRPCWVLMDGEKNRWTRGEVICAWFEPRHSDDDAEDDPDGEWRQYPTVLVKDKVMGETWILQLPDDGIAFCDKPHVEWTVADVDL